MLVFEEWGKPVYPAGEKPFGAVKRTNNKLNPHLTPGPFDRRLALLLFD